MWSKDLITLLLMLTKTLELLQFAKLISYKLLLIEQENDFSFPSAEEVEEDLA